MHTGRAIWASFHEFVCFYIFQRGHLVGYRPALLLWFFFWKYHSFLLTSRCLVLPTCTIKMYNMYEAEYILYITFITNYNWIINTVEIIATEFRGKSGSYHNNFFIEISNHLTICYVSFAAYWFQVVFTEGRAVRVGLYLTARSVVGFGQLLLHQCKSTGRLV